MNRRSALWLTVGVVGFGLVCPVSLAQLQGAAEVSLNRGIDAFVSEDYAVARRQFDAALALDPEFAAAHYFLGLTLLQTALGIADTAPRDALLERALAEFEQARLRDPQMVLAYLDGAIAGTIIGRFDEAESGFHKFIEERPDDPLPHLFLAVLHYRRAQDDPAHLADATQSLDSADAALQRSGKVDRTLRAHILFYRGLVLLEQDERDAAREALAEGYELDPDSDIGRQSKDILDRIVDRRPWDLSLRLGYDYDTNVTIRGHHVRRLPGEDKGDDWRFGLGSDFVYRITDTEEFLFGVGIVTYNSWHTDITEFNVQSYGGNIFTAYAPRDADYLTLSMRYDWDHTLVGNESFLSRHRITPQIDIREADWTSTTIFYQFADNNYFNQDRDRRLNRDGDTHSLGVTQRFILAEMYDRHLTADLSYRFENVTTDGREFDSENHIFALGITVPLPEDFTFDFVGQAEVDYYDNRSLFDRNRSHRKDVITTFIFALTKEFNANLSARLQVDVIEDDSTIKDRSGGEVFSYDRIIYGLSFTYRF